MTRSSGPRLAIVCGYPLDVAPGQRYRWERYLEALRDDGYSIDVLPLLDDEAYRVLYREGHGLSKIAAVLKGLARRVGHLRTVREADIVLLYREAFFLGGPWLERAIFASGTPVVFDFDDAIWLPNVSAANRWIGWLKWGDKTRQLLPHCAVVLAGNDYLAEYARRFCDDVRILPTIVDTDVYVCPERTKERGEVTIGWTGSSTTVQYLDFLDPVLGQIQRESGVTIRIVGAPDYRPASYQAELLPWTSESEVADLCPIDIGVMPLPHDEWARGKCGGKLIQYMGLGMAAVASPVGVNSDIISHGENGLLASTEEEWLSALRTLVADRELRARLGRQARTTIESGYSTRATYPAFRQALRDALDR